ncbi:hypothetical protein CLF_113161 [Clonorchis sinensis]|uniref:Uncharacterized protein n=1 Tax=Clonorchis sinensis TaxID=79923 RepID=G7YXS5_CLOSI|nr:hypothetical protein CLF_113161 [Clonorchis sinensis]
MRRSSPRCSAKLNCLDHGAGVRYLQFFRIWNKRYKSTRTSEREDLVKDLDKLKKKQQKMETMERTGENLAKLSKVIETFCITIPCVCH